MKQRRALTTIVGGVFFLIVIITAASYLTYTMNLFENFSENVFAVAQERENRKKEKESKKRQLCLSALCQKSICLY